MNIGFNPAKDAGNITKHGVSLALAAALEWDLMVCREDDRANYGELRLACYAPIESKVYAVVFCDQGDSYRIISLRPAEPREVRYYAGQI